MKTQTLYERLNQEYKDLIDLKILEFPSTYNDLKDALKDEFFVCEIKYKYIMELKNLKLFNSPYDIFKELELC